MVSAEPTEGRNRSSRAKAREVLDFLEKTECLWSTEHEARCCSSGYARSALTRIEHTYLFVPADRVDRIENALASTADVVIVDLEDSVKATEKSKARGQLFSITPKRPCHLRINDDATSHFEDDIQLVNACPWISGVVLPKVVSSKQIVRLRKLIGKRIPILALIESAKGVSEVEDIARSGVRRLLFGPVDYSLDLGAEPSQELFDYPRSRLVVASVAAGLVGPVDGPTLALSEEVSLIREVARAVALGMKGKLCIHPSQLKIAGDAFQPSEKDLDWARSVLAAHSNARHGAFALGGEMIDSPVVDRARTLLERARNCDH